MLSRMTPDFKSGNSSSTVFQRVGGWWWLCLVVVAVAVGSLFLGNFVFNRNHDTSETQPVAGQEPIEAGEDDRFETPRSTTPSEPIENVIKNVNEQTFTITLVQSLSELVDATRFESRLARTLALRRLLARANVKELQQYWEKAQSLEIPKFKEEVQQGIVQRWSVLDPVAAFTFVNRQSSDTHKTSFLRLVFREWSLSNLDDALSHAGSLDQESKEIALRSVLIAREDLSINERRELARELDCDWIAIEVLTQIADADVLSDPKLEWETFLRNQGDNLQNLSEKQSQLLAKIAFAWIDQDGFDVFEEMQESFLPSTLLLDTTKAVAYEIVADKPEIAFDFVLDVFSREPGYEYGNLVVELAIHWAQIDPKSAFNATLKVDRHSLQRRLQKHTLRQWAHQDSSALLSVLDTLPEHLHPLIREIVVIEAAEKSRDMVAEVLNDIEDRNHRERVARHVASNWGEHDIDEAMQWIESDGSVLHIQSKLKEVAFREFAQRDPRLALETALNQPLSAEEKGLEAAVIDSVARWGSLDTAISMLPNVRRGKTRIEAFDSVIEQSISEDDLDRALELFLQLCEHEPTITSGPLETVVTELPEKLFKSLDRISSERMRIRAARELYLKHSDSDTFNQTQLERLNEISQSGLSNRMREKMENVIDSVLDGRD